MVRTRDRLADSSGGEAGGSIGSTMSRLVSEHGAGVLGRGVRAVQRRHLQDGAAAVRIDQVRVELPGLEQRARGLEALQVGQVRRGEGPMLARRLNYLTI